MIGSIELERMTKQELLVKSYFYKGACHAALEQHEDAIKYYDLALSSGKREPYILIAKVTSLLKVNRNQEALESSDTSILLLNKELKNFGSSKKDNLDEYTSEELDRMIEEVFDSSEEILKETEKESKEEEGKRAAAEFFKIIEEANTEKSQEEFLKIFEK